MLSPASLVLIFLPYFKELAIAVRLTRHNSSCLFIEEKGGGGGAPGETPSS